LQMFVFRKKDNTEFRLQFMFAIVLVFILRESVDYNVNPSLDETRTHAVNRKTNTNTCSLTVLSSLDSFASAGCVVSMENGILAAVSTTEKFVQKMPNNMNGVKSVIHTRAEVIPIMVTVN